MTPIIQHASQAYFMTSIAHVLNTLRETQLGWRLKHSPRSLKRRRNLSLVIEALTSLSTVRCESLLNWIRTTTGQMSMIDASLREVTSMIKGAKKQLYVDHHMLLARDRIHTMRHEITRE